jgi:hypothetical protein
VPQTHEELGFKAGAEREYWDMKILITFSPVRPLGWL